MQALPPAHPTSAVWSAPGKRLAHRRLLVVLPSRFTKPASPSRFTEPLHRVQPQRPLRARKAAVVELDGIWPGHGDAGCRMGEGSRAGSAGGGDPAGGFSGAELRGGGDGGGGYGGRKLGGGVSQRGGVRGGGVGGGDGGERDAGTDRRLDRTAVF